MNFKNRSISSGQGVVQIKPNSVWSMPCVGRVKNNKNFWYSLPRKKVSFLNEKLRFLRIGNFKKSLFDRVIELSKSIQTGYGVYHEYLESKTRKIFAIACLGKKLGFHTEICCYFE